MVIVPAAANAPPQGPLSEMTPRPMADAASFFGVFDGERCSTDRSEPLSIPVLGLSLHTGRRDEQDRSRGIWRLEYP